MQVRVVGQPGGTGGVVIFAGDNYLPMYVQGVRGGSPLLAGLALLPISLGWLTGATISGRLLLR